MKFISLFSTVLLFAAGTAQAGVYCTVTQANAKSGKAALGEFRDVQETPDFENVLAYPFKLTDGAVVSFVYRQAQMGYDRLDLPHYEYFIQVQGVEKSACERGFLSSIDDKGKIEHTGVKTTCTLSSQDVLTVACFY